MEYWHSTAGRGMIKLAQVDELFVVILAPMPSRSPVCLLLFLVLSQWNQMDAAVHRNYLQLALQKDPKSTARRLFDEADPVSQYRDELMHELIRINPGSVAQHLSKCEPDESTSYSTAGAKTILKRPRNGFFPCPSRNRTATVSTMSVTSWPCNFLSKKETAPSHTSQIAGRTRIRWAWPLISNARI